jgi:lipoprotein-anchoring transpeptidase ErfK/SrfK
LEGIVRLPQFPGGDYLGRVAVYPNAYSTELKTQPDENAPAIRPAAHDETVTWLRDVVGTNVAGRANRRWAQVHTSDGYDGFIYAADLQPVRNIPNAPLSAIPEGKNGFWTEITVPYVDLQLAGPAIGAGVKDLLLYNEPIRLYYGQVAWIDEIRADDSGTIMYRFNEAPQHGYGPGDLLYGEAGAFRVLTEQDVAPISPNVDPAAKRIEIDATPGRQILSCYEGNSEVYFCRTSTGFVGQITDYSTPAGEQSVAWKIISLHMGANLPASGSGYDTMAVPWSVFFNVNAGVAVHGTFWHNDFGVRRSHGCVNVSPEDAKWIFRWTTPAVSLDQSEIRLNWPDVGGAFSTSVTVDESTATI